MEEQEEENKLEGAITRIFETIIELFKIAEVPSESISLLTDELASKLIKPQNPLAFILDPDQIEALKILVRRYIHDRYSLLLPADTGWGKTRVGIWLAAFFNVLLGMRPAIVCPKILIPMWSKLLAEADLKPLFIMTYSKVAGKKSGVNHPYLTRGAGATGPFYATDAWLKEITEGVLLICDESQAVKNKTSARHYAVYALINSGAITPKANSRVLHCSASWIDKSENWSSLYRNLSLITGRELWHTNPHTKMLEYKPTPRHPEGFAFGWLLEECMKVNPRVTNEVILGYVIKHMNAKVLDEVLLFLWRGIWRERCVIPVTDPVYTNPYTGEVFKRIRANLFITLDEEGRSLANQALMDLRDARIIRKDGRIDLEAAKKNFGAVQQALMKLCKAKINDVARHALIKLREKKKVIIYCPFMNDQETLMHKLALYNPLRLHGGVTDQATEITAKFNENNDKHMILIATMEVGGQGISLHDTYGTYRRCIFVIPTYTFLPMFQASNRAYRRGLMSDTESYIVYSNNTAIESLLVNGMIKTEVSMQVLMPGSGRIFPGAYEFVIEDDGPDKKDLKEKLNAERARARAMMVELEEI